MHNSVLVLGSVLH